MKIDPAIVDKEQLVELFNYIQGDLLKADAKMRNKTQLGEYLFGNNSDWSRMVVGTLTTPKFRKNLAKALSFLSYDLYRDPERKLYWKSSVPTLSELHEKWEVKYIGYYVYHYVETKLGKGNRRRSIVRQAQLIVNYQTAEVCLAFFRNKNNRIQEVTTSNISQEETKRLSAITITDNDRWVERRYHGTIISTRKTWYLVFPKQVEIDREGKVNVQSEQLFIVLNRDKEQTSISDYTVGNFASHGSSSGLCVVRKFATGDRQLHEISNVPVAPRIQHLLINRYYSSNDHKGLYDLERHDRLLTEVSDLKGFYIGFSLVNRRGKECVSLAVFIISEDGVIKYTSKNEQSEKSGEIFHITETIGGPAPQEANEKTSTATSAVSCCIDYNHDLDHYRMFMVLETNAPSRHSELPKASLIGTYSGLFDGDEYPQSGRVILVPFSECKAWKQPQNVFFTNTEGLEKVRHDFPFLSDFFGGYYDDFADRPFALDYNHMNMIAQKYRGNAKEVKDAQEYEGYYLLYYPNSRRKIEHLYRRVLHIGGAYNTARWFKKIDPDTNHRQFFSGYAKFIDGCLVLQFEQEETNIEGRPDKPQSISRGCKFYVGKNPTRPDQFKVLSGVLFRNNNDGFPVSSNAKMLFLGKEFREDAWIKANTGTVGKVNLTKEMGIDAADLWTLLDT